MNLRLALVDVAALVVAVPGDEPEHEVAEAELDGERVTLRAGELVFGDGANDFAPVNSGEQEFAMLITLVRR